mgnify:CR=1 FL=1
MDYGNTHFGINKNINKIIKALRAAVKQDESYAKKLYEMSIGPYGADNKEFKNSTDVNEILFDNYSEMNIKDPRFAHMISSAMILDCKEILKEHNKEYSVFINSLTKCEKVWFCDFINVTDSFLERVPFIKYLFKMIKDTYASEKPGQYVWHQDVAD